LAKVDELRQNGGREQKRSECHGSGLAVLLLPIVFRPRSCRTVMRPHLGHSQRQNLPPKADMLAVSAPIALLEPLIVESDRQNTGPVCIWRRSWAARVRSRTCRQ